MLYREDRLFSNRFNFFLLMQSFLFLTFVTSVTSSNELGKGIGFYISIFGLIITFYFLQIFGRTIIYIHYLREQLKKEDRNYCDIWNNRESMWKEEKNKQILLKLANKFHIKFNKKNGRGVYDRGVNELLGFVLPMLFFFVWLMLFICIFLVPFFL